MWDVFMCATIICAIISYIVFLSYREIKHSKIIALVFICAALWFAFCTRPFRYEHEEDMRQKKIEELQRQCEELGYECVPINSVR